MKQITLNVYQFPTKKIEARNPLEALAIFTRRGKRGLGLTWKVTEDRKTGWFVAVNDAGRTLERKIVKFRQVGTAKIG